MLYILLLVLKKMQVFMVFLNLLLMLKRFSFEPFLTKDPKKLLPSGVLERATFIYQELLQYCVDMILWNDGGQYENLPEELRRFVLCR